MAYILRTIRKARWYDHESISWLAAGEFQADALSDLKTDDNELSVWHVADDRSNLDQVVAALASTRDHVSNLDYALLDQNFIFQIQINIWPTVGNSPHEEANLWHRDLIEFSALKLYTLAKSVFENAERKRYSEKEILRLIARAIASGRIDRTQLKLSENDLRRIDKEIANSRLSR